VPRPWMHRGMGSMIAAETTALGDSGHALTASTRHAVRAVASPLPLCSAAQATAAANGQRRTGSVLGPEWAHPSHVRARSGLTPPTSAPRVGSFLPHVCVEWRGRRAR
jgi:hypothetical protein